MIFMAAQTSAKGGKAQAGSEGGGRRNLSDLAHAAFCETDFRKASVETLGGGLRTSLPTSRRAFACPAQVGLVVLNQPPSKPMIFEQETAC